MKNIYFHARLEKETNKLIFVFEVEKVLDNEKQYNCFIFGEGHQTIGRKYLIDQTRPFPIYQIVVTNMTNYEKEYHCSLREKSRKTAI